MAQFDNNGNLQYETGQILRKDGTLIPAKLIEQPGLPASDWTERVKAHLIQSKERLAIQSVDTLPGEINQPPRVSFVVAFDTGRSKTEDAYNLLQMTLAACVKDQSGHSYYDYGQAMQIVENHISIAKG